MANNYGMTPAYADLVLGTLNNVPLTVPIVCAQIHNGDPGSAASNNVSTVVGARQQVTMTSPSGGGTGLTGAGPSWNVTGADTLEALSLWNGFNGDPSAIAMFTMPIQPAVTVADGDVVILNTANLAATGLAA